MISPIRYRGHGRYEAYYPGLSIAGVMGHELIHMASYRRRAAQEGQLILQSGVRLHLTLRDGQLVATGGEAYVRTRPMQPAPATAPSAQGGPTSDDRPGHDGEPSGTPAAMPPAPGPGVLPGPDPSAVEAQLRREQQRIEQLLWQLRARSRPAHGQPGAPQAPGRQPGSTEAVDRLERVAVLLQFAEQMPASKAQQAFLALARQAYRAAVAAGGNREGSVIERAA